jgi:lactate dehydrogenase-like 2-hydroxyacid dehydrogenase
LVGLANAVSVAEHTIFLLLYLAKNVKEKTVANKNDNNNRSGLLFERRVASVLGSEIQWKHSLVLGLTLFVGGQGLLTWGHNIFLLE